MKTINGILLLIYIFVIFTIDFNKISTSLKFFSLKNIFRKINLLHFLIIIFVNFYIEYIFKDNYILYLINLFCFFGIYICSITDIFLKYIYNFVIYLFFIVISILNLYGGYFKISCFSFITALLLYGFIYFITKIIYKREVFGLGDIYALSLISIATDSFTIFHIGLFSFVVAALFYITKIIISRDFKKYKNYEIAFVPFILISYLIIIYF